MGIEDDDIPGDKLTALPTGALPGDIWRQWAARANATQEFNINELAREQAGDSPRHLMVLAEDDPKEKERRADQKRRELAIADEQRREITERQNQLLARIEERQLELDKRRREIEDNALRLRDGRRVYVDGNRFRDEQGRVLSGPDEAEAARAHGHQPHSSTWTEKEDTDRQLREQQELKDRILKDRDGSVSQDAAARHLDAAEQQFAAEMQQRTAQAPTDYGTGDYMAELGGDYTISSIPAFTDAANPEAKTAPEKKDTDVSETKIAPRPLGQGAFKLG